jgi:hypothetical protein
MGAPGPSPVYLRYTDCKSDILILKETITGREL